MKHILVRYGELTLKGKNRNVFITKLYQNIKFRLKQLKEFIVIEKDNNSLTIKINDQEKLDEVVEILSNIFGIYSISIVEIIKNDIDLLQNKIIEVAQQIPPGSYKLEVLRKDKTFPLTSPEVKNILAPIILKNTSHLTVDVHNPNFKLEVLIKHNGTYIYSSKINGLKGLPVGVGGKALSLLSGGIDSPVASYLTLKRGMQVDFLHFMTPPHTSKEALDKVFKLAKKVELMHMREDGYRITIMRRVFIKIANILAKTIDAKCIITGDNLGQVASQTIDSIDVINCVSDLPILRPLITFDKEEIIEIAQKIDTFNTSILPFDDVCSLFVPKSPVIKPKRYVAENQEKELLIDEMIEHTIKKSIKMYIHKGGEFVEKE
ncbi:hypothetical protein FQR65_LT17094 [Abscondita terminalis]|nr:hypothetical protein FQR65_LT17094 [Abscondita terminalis]